MHAVRASHAERLPVLLCPGDNRTKRPLEPVEHERPASWTESESAVSRTSEDVRPKWNHRPSSPRRSATASTNAATSWFVSRSTSATRSGDGGRATDGSVDGVGGHDAEHAQPSRAASSTSSIRESLASSDQIRAMAGRE